MLAIISQIGCSPREEKNERGNERQLKAEDKRRDYPVIERALVDLCDSASPINKAATENGHIGKYILLGPTTSRSVNCLSRESLTTLLKYTGRTIPDEIGRELRRRNPGQPAGLGDFRSRRAQVRIRDILEEFHGTEREFAEFWLPYSDSWRYVYAFLPAFSKDGNTAVLVFDAGPSPHGAKIIYYLNKTEGAWQVKWRHQYLSK
jgi:hypothetical protein